MKFEVSFNEIAPDDLCLFCSYMSDCRGVACYGGEPVFPPCSNGDYEELIDWDDLNEYLKELEEV